MDDALAQNRAHWDSRVPIHLKGYDLDRFRADSGFLSAVVRFDQPRLGPVSGLDVAHLQCHIGTDTLSLHRIGARVVGLDLSPASVQAARRLARELGHDVRFVEAEVTRAPEVLGAERYDLVYTGIGALCWLPDLRAWAQAVATLLRPGGRLFVRDGHPLLYALDDRRDDEELRVAFAAMGSAPLPLHETTTYEGDGAPVTSPACVCFLHGVGDILGAVLDAGLEVLRFDEHDSAPWNPLGVACEPSGPLGEWRLRDRPERLPMTFTLVARKRIDGPS